MKLRVVLGGLVILVGNTYLKKGDNGGLRPAIGTAVIIVVVAAVLWGVIVFFRRMEPKFADIL